MVKRSSVRRLYTLGAAGFGILGLAGAGVCFGLSRNLRASACVAGTAVLLLAWTAVLAGAFQRMLAEFTGGLCAMLDSMMDGREWPAFNLEEESLFSRIAHRMERLYGVMEHTRRQAEGERNELQSLLSDISHQTKTPIANLKMINDTLLSRAMTQEKKREFLQAAASQLDKLDFLIQAMVKTSRLETGVIRLEKRTAPIADTLAAALNGILVPAQKKGITLEVDCPENLSISHDPRWTAEALFNLLDNGVKYTAPGGRIQLQVKLWEMYLKISVSDTGRGIPEQEQAAVFRRFYREEAVHETEGIGIGLYLTREIVTLQGGYMQLASQVGKGSTFSVFLPRR